MRLDLSSLDLMVSGPSSPGLAAALRVRTEQGGATTVPDFAMGFGTAVPADVKSAFTALARFDADDDFTIEDGGTWLHTDLTRTEQRWFVQWRDETALVCGEISAGGVEADGLTLGNARLRVVLRSGPADANVVHIWLEGEAAFSSDVGPLRLNGVGGRFTLEVNAEGLPDLQQLVENPASVLEGAFTGRLTVSITAEQIGLLTSVEFRHAEVNLSAEVSSPAGSRRLELEEATLKLGGSLLFAGAELARAQLAARVGAWPAAADATFEIDGQGTLTLPASLSEGLGGGGMAATVGLRCSTEETHFEFTAAGVRLEPAVNVLGLSGASLHLVFSRDAAGRWSLEAEGTLEQSWSNIADRLRAAGLVDLRGSESFPDVRATLALVARSLPTTSAQRAALRVELTLEPVLHGHPYEGPLGGLPVRISALRFSIAAAVAASGFGPPTVEAEGRLRITGALASILPWQDLGLGAEFVPGEQMPSLRLYVTNLPAFALPPLQRDGQSIPILKIERAELELGTTVGFGGHINFLPELTPPELVARLGLPPEFEGFLGPVNEFLVGLEGHWNLAYDAAADSGRMEISFKKSDAPELDVFEVLRSIVPARQRPEGEFLLDDFTLLSIQPLDVRFLVSFGGTEAPLLQLDAGVSCTVLGEKFDTRCALRLRGGIPEFELAAGVDDPISISLPGVESLAGDTAQRLLDHIADLYAAPPDELDKLEEPIEKIAAFFTQPGMDTAAQFELRQLRLVVRPTDADAPVELSGVMRPVRLPDFVSRVLPVVPSVTLGTTSHSVFFALSLEDDPNPRPLISVPLGDNSQVDFTLRGFEIAYSWVSNSLDLGLRVVIDTTNVQFFDETIGTGVCIPDATPGAPSMASAVAIKTIASVPPVPVPEWNVTFGDVEDPDNRGIEFIFGIPNQRFLTLNLRKTAFSITRTPFGPGGDFDGGFIFGNPPADEDDVSQFYLLGSCIEGTFITYPSVLTPLINPFGTIFMPPFPLGNTSLDIFFKELSVGLNIPGLIFARLSFEKRLPEVSLFTIIELIYLASQGFAVPLPNDSSLRKLFFVALRGELKLHLPPALFAAEPGGGAKMVEVLDLDVEFNAAVFLGAVAQCLSAGRQIMEDVGEGLNLIVNNPSMLVRLVPRDKRSFTFDESLSLPGLQLRLSVSAFLLTPEELREELILFHESRRPFGKGTGRVRIDSTPPQPGPVIDRSPTLTASQNVFWAEVVDKQNSFNHNGAPFLEYIDEKCAVVERDFYVRALGDINQKLKPSIRDALRKLLFEGNDPFWDALRASTPAQRRSALERRGLGFAVELVEAATQASLAAQSPEREQEIQERLVVQLADAAPLTTPRPLDLGEDYETVAAELTSQLVLDRPPPRADNTLFGWFRRIWSRLLDTLLGRGRRPEIEIAAPEARRRLFQRRFPRREHRVLVHALIAVGDAAEDKLSRRPPENQAEESAFRAEVERALLRALNKYAVEHKSLDLVLLGNNLRRRVQETIHNAFKGTRQTQTLTRDVVTHDLNKTLQLTASVSGKDGGNVPAGDTVREVVGHQLKPRPDGPYAQVAFAVDVPSPYVAFRVEYRQGRFKLVVSDSSHVELSATTLPAQITSTFTPAPGVAAELTRMFVITPKVVERALRDDEKAARDADPQESSDTLYQHSLFARDEYEIRDSGGRRGKLMLADLLRAPDGSYVSPGGPVLIAGGRINVFNYGDSLVDLGVVGLLALPVGESPSGVFLYGYQHLVLPLPFRYELTLDGDFHVVAGDMWPATLADPSIERNSVSFSGVATLSRDDREIVNSSASGHFHYPSPDEPIELSLTMSLSVSDTWELEFSDVSFFKASFSAEGDLHIAFDGELSLSFDAEVTFEWQVAEFETMTVRLPSVSVCGPNPFGWMEGEPDKICVTIGGGTMEVPDLSRRRWRDLPDPPDASISASLDGGAIRIDLEVEDDSRFNYHFEL